MRHILFCQGKIIWNIWLKRKNLQYTEEFYVNFFNTLKIFVYLGGNHFIEMRGQVDYKDGVRFMGIPLAPYYSAEYGLYAYYAGENGTIWSEKEQKFLEPILTPSGYYRIRLKYKSYKVHFLEAV